MTLRPYNDRDYRLARAWLTAHPDTVCWYPDCDQPAEDIDHVPSLIKHNHRRGTGCCSLRPACAHHNRSSGATDGNEHRSGRTERELIESARRWRS